MSEQTGGIWRELREKKHRTVVLPSEVALRSGRVSTAPDDGNSDQSRGQEDERRGLWGDYCGSRSAVDVRAKAQSDDLTADAADSAQVRAELDEAVGCDPRAIVGVAGRRAKWRRGSALNEYIEERGEVENVGSSDARIGPRIWRRCADSRGAATELRGGLSSEGSAGSSRG